MNNQYKIISDGSCDLSKELAEKRDIDIVPFYVSFDDTTYLREGTDIKVRSFYQEMVDDPNIFPKSSMPSVQDYVDAFMPYVKASVPVICICITSKFSGSLQSATNARSYVLEKYPSAKITVVDSMVNTVLQGLMVLETAAMRDDGIPYEETLRYLDKMKSSGRIFFTVGNMEYLSHGGRIGKVTAVAGSVLGIRPVITLKEGEIYPSAVGRSRKRTVDKTIDLLINYLKENNKNLYDYSLSVGFGGGRLWSVRRRTPDTANWCYNRSPYRTAPIGSWYYKKMEFLISRGLSDRVVKPLALDMGVSTGMKSQRQVMKVIS